MRVSISQLATLNAISMHDSFAEAAKSLGVSQPAVSSQIKRLEQEFGVKLARRIGKRVKLTPLGEDVVEKARRALSLLHDIDLSLASAGELMGGHFRVGLSCHNLIKDLLSRFMLTYPYVKVVAKVQDTYTLLKGMEAGYFDLITVTLDQPHPEYVNHLYSVQDIVLLVSSGHPWASREAIHVDELHGQRMIYRETSFTRTIFERELVARKIAPLSALELDTWESYIAAVVSNIGFGIALRDEVRDESEVVALRMSGAHMEAGQYMLIHPDMEDARTVRAFTDMALASRDKRQQQDVASVTGS
ncbi:MAG: LysR family transcriptional regulator [Oceanidesulfovibrio sp.]